jgi:hypothetical protein
MHSFGSYATKSYAEVSEAVAKNEIEDLPVAGALLMHAQIREHAHVICYSTGLREEDQRLLGFEHASGIEEALRSAFRRHGENARVGVLECGEVVAVCADRLR